MTEQPPQPDAIPSAPLASPILLPPTPSAIRDELTEMVVRDLLGPAGGPDEELDQRGTTSIVAICWVCWPPSERWLKPNNRTL